MLSKLRQHTNVCQHASEISPILLCVVCERKFVILCCADICTDLIDVVTAPHQPMLNSMLNPSPLLATENSLIINWTVGHHGGDSISDYIVTWSRNATFPEENTHNRTLSVSRNSNLTQQGGMWTLEDLAEGQPYYVKIQAKNCFGDSISSPQILCTLCGEFLETGDFPVFRCLNNFTCSSPCTIYTSKRHCNAWCWYHV